MNIIFSRPGCVFSIGYHGDHAARLKESHWGDSTDTLFSSGNRLHCVKTAIFYLATRQKIKLVSCLLTVGMFVFSSFLFVFVSSIYNSNLLTHIQKSELSTKFILQSIIWIKITSSGHKEFNRRQTIDTYHSISFACLLGLVKTSAGRGRGKKRRDVYVRSYNNLQTCFQTQTQLFSNRLLWILKGCLLRGSVNKPTSLLFSTSSMTARLSYTQPTERPSKLAAVKRPAESPHTAHHRKLTPRSNI